MVCGNAWHRPFAPWHTMSNCRWKRTGVCGLAAASAAIVEKMAQAGKVRREGGASEAGEDDHEGLEQRDTQASVHDQGKMQQGKARGIKQQQISDGRVSLPQCVPSGDGEEQSYPVRQDTGDAKQAFAKWKGLGVGELIEAEAEVG